MEPVTFESNSEESTARFGRIVAGCLHPGAVVAMCGPLGAGKTRLVQAIAASAGVDPEEVTSPTFTLVHEYAGRVPIWHVDAYRVADPDEFAELGLDEIFESGGWTLVEWADKFPQCLPAGWLEIRIEVVSPAGRKFFLQGTDPQHAGVAECVARKLASAQG